jgi:hypothetical protein
MSLTKKSVYTQLHLLGIFIMIYFTNGITDISVSLFTSYRSNFKTTAIIPQERGGAVESVKRGKTHSYT